MLRLHSVPIRAQSLPKRSLRMAEYRRRFVHRYLFRNVVAIRVSLAPGSSQKWVSSAAIVITHSIVLFWRTRPNTTPRRLASTCGLTSAVSVGGQEAALSRVDRILAQDTVGISLPRTSGL